ncbi:AAA family ATPase [Bacillus salacetis]|uniref:AAA family ATPase n=1 Tax=Bacillus salacetis TaxID=2315464 RepID=UPI003B9F1E41
MQRMVIMTIGKTHSGKSTFAKLLEERLNDSLLIDQDNHAEFLNEFYPKLLPDKGPNTLKYTVSKTILDYAAAQTDLHIILCNSNRHREGRSKILEYLKDQGFKSVLVNFEISDDILQQRVSDSNRSTKIFRSASSFSEVLMKQNSEEAESPGEEEADHLFSIQKPGDIHQVIEEIIQISLPLKEDV